MKILFRVDSSPTIGLGHLMRCLVLAKQYEKSEIVFASFEVNEELVEKNGYRVLKLQTHSIDEFILHVKEFQADLVIIDSYNINYDDEKKLKKSFTCKLMALDDTYEKHYTDILLNHNIYADEKLYKNKVPAFCELRCGSKYTLIRDEFKAEKQKKRKKEGVFVALGGSDVQNLTLKILKKLPKSLHVKVATTSQNKNLSTLEQFVRVCPNTTLHVNSNNIAKLMNSSCFAIISPSVIAHEVLYLNLPFLAIKTAKNQNYMYKFLRKKGYGVLDDLDDLKNIERKIKC